MSEDVGSVSVAVSLRNGILARDVIVTLQTLDGTAIGGFLFKSLYMYGVHTMEPVKSSIIFIPKPIGGMDFPNISIDLTLNISSTTQTVMVPILNDMVHENLEYFSLALMSNDPAVTLNPATIYINVVDDIDSKLKLYRNSALVVACTGTHCSDCFLFLFQWSQWDSPQQPIQCVRMLKILVSLSKC